MPVQRTCETCEAHFLVPPSALQYRAARFCSEPCKQAAQKGAQHPSWRGGSVAYYGPNWNSQKRAARKRDGYTCRQCGVTEVTYGRALDVHHLTPFKSFGYVPGQNFAYLQANALNNLLSLCVHCHSRVEPRGCWPSMPAPTEHGMKYCPRCDSVKPVAAFCRNRARRDGLASHCMACFVVWRREYRHRCRLSRRNIPGAAIPKLETATAVR